MIHVQVPKKGDPLNKELLAALKVPLGGMAKDYGGTVWRLLDGTRSTAEVQELADKALMDIGFGLIRTIPNARGDRLYRRGRETVRLTVNTKHGTKDRCSGVVCAPYSL